MDILSLTSNQPVSVDTQGRAVGSKGKTPVPLTSGVDPTDKAPPGSDTTGAATQKEALRTGQKSPENLLDLLKGLMSDNQGGTASLSLGDVKVAASLKQVTLPPQPEDLLNALAAMGINLPPNLLPVDPTAGAPDTWMKAVQDSVSLPQSVKSALSYLLQQTMAKPLSADKLIDLGRPVPAPVPPPAGAPLPYPLPSPSTPPAAESTDSATAVFESNLVQNTGSGQVFDATMVEALNVTAISGDAAAVETIGLGRPDTGSGSPPDRTHVGPLPGEENSSSASTIGLGRPVASSGQVPNPVTTSSNGVIGTGGVSQVVSPTTGVPPAHQQIPSPTIYGALGIPDNGVPPTQKGGHELDGISDHGPRPSPTIYGALGIPNNGVPPTPKGGHELDGISDHGPRPSPTIYGALGIPDGEVPPTQKGGHELDGISQHANPPANQNGPSRTIFGALEQFKQQQASSQGAAIVPDPELQWPTAGPVVASSGKFVDIEPKPVVIDDSKDSSSAISNDKSTIGLGRPDLNVAVKPLDNPVPLPAATVKSVANQIADRIETMVLGKKSGSAVVRLNPMDLGTITLTVKSFGNKVDTSIQASHDDVRAALHAHRQDLVQNVESRGLSLNSFQVGQDASSNSSQQNHQALQTEADRNAQLRQAVGLRSDAPTPQAAYQPASNLGVDYFI